MSNARHVGKIVFTLPNPALDPDGTVLLTGGTGGLGSLIAKHLVVNHGVRNLLLTSRRGSRAEGAERLQTELADLGARARIVACDVSDRQQVRSLLDGVEREHPLSAVIHAAGVLDDGTIGSLTPERLDRVLEPKVDAAWYLHELTRGMDLRWFVLFSSAAGVLGGAGQGNYAAANSFLDGLAAHRRAQGLPAVSMAWGQWLQDTGMTDHLSEGDLARMVRSGVLALRADEGLELFDAALTADRALLVPVRLDTATLRSRARAGELSVLLRGLVQGPIGSAPAHSGPSLARRLVSLAGRERERVMLQFIRTEAASLLGHASAGAIEAQRAFKEAGFDSLTAVELRNRIASATGLGLPPTLVFEYPTPKALAAHLLDQISRPETVTADAIGAELDKLQGMLLSVGEDDLGRDAVSVRLQAFLASLRDRGLTDVDSIDEELESASDEEMLELIDRELEVS
jgi:NAD(P)-dependent dehydrogenase (short-subunit alcohol dehydrogenase family)/acyl carrier protein